MGIDYTRQRAVPPAAPPAATRPDDLPPRLHALYDEVGAAVGRFGLTGHRARVAVCLDRSRKTRDLYRSGWAQTLVERAMLVALHLGQRGCDVFLFGDGIGYPVQSLTPELVDRFLDEPLRSFDFASPAELDMALRHIRAFADPDLPATSDRGGDAAPAMLPVLGIVVGATDPKVSTRMQTADEQIVQSSHEGVFLDLLAIGITGHHLEPPDPAAGRKVERFPNLERFPHLPGRGLDNLQYASALRPDLLPDAQLFEFLLAKYAWWVPQARAAGLLLDEETAKAPPTPRQRHDTQDRQIDALPPQLLPAAGAARQLLAARGASGLTARVAVVVQPGGGRNGYLKSGAAHHLAERALALSAVVGDSPEVDLHFGARPYEPGRPLEFEPIRPDTVAGLPMTLGSLVKAWPSFEDGLHAATWQLLVESGNQTGGPRPVPGPVPKLVLYLTSSGLLPNPKREVQMLRAWSYHPVYWMFVGVGAKLSLAHLANVPDRYLPNIGSMTIEEPRQLTDEQLFAGLLDPFLQWVQQARAAGLITEA